MSIKSITVNQIVIKTNKGHVAVSHCINGEIGAYEATDLPFLLDDKNSSMPNVVWELSQLLKQAKETYLVGNSSRLMIAVPETVFIIANNIDLLTRMLWSNTYILSKDRKRELTKKEFEAYKELLLNYKSVIGKAVIVNNRYTPINRKEGESRQDATWCQLNEEAGQILGFGKKAPTEVVAETPAEYKAHDEDEDMPF